MQQGRCGLKGCGLAPVENLPDIKAEQPFLMPLTPVKEKKLGKTKQDDPAWWLRPAENVLGYDLFKCDIQNPLGFFFIF